jgi:hypothetical protein
MIRREATREDGGKVWLLIAQSEHASLASFLACHWAEFPGLSAAAREQLLGAILTHDQGWDAWEAEPRFDHKAGRPPQFTEMPGATSLPIWSESIDACEALGPLAGYAASGHFSAMADHHFPELGPADQAVAAAFLLAETERRTAAEKKWITLHGPQAAAELPLAVEYLQAFDAISLWFCCALRTEPLEFTVPHGGATSYTFTPLEARPPQITIAPWPLAVDETQLSAEADVLPVAKYRNLADFQAARTERTILTWDLVRNG